MSCLPGMPCYGSHPNNQNSQNCGVDPCFTYKTNTGLVYYAGPNLPCINVNTCETLTTILQKIDEALCGENLVQNFINTLINNEELFNLFCTQIIKRCVDCDYILDCVIDGGCCGGSTSTTTTQYPPCLGCDTYQVTNNSPYEATVTYISCAGENPCWTEITINSGQNFYICACEGSISSSCDVEIVAVDGGCNIPCVCKTYVISVTDANVYYPISINFRDCDGNLVQTIVSKSNPVVVCACEGSIQENPAITATEISDDCNVQCLGDCDILYNTSDIAVDGQDPQGGPANPKVYALDMISQTSSELYIPGAVGSFDIAHTKNKLWLYQGGFGPWTFYEYNITLCPFTAILNRTFSLPAQFYSKGLFATSDTTLIGVFYDINQYFASIDISTGTPVITELFPLSEDREISGDILVTTDGKLIATVKDINTSNLYISQYDLATGTLEVDIDITATVNNPWGLFEYAGNIYIGSETSSSASTIYLIDKNFPYTITSQFTLNTDMNGASSTYPCTSASFSTTTTTTTKCYCYTVDTTPFGEYTVEWIDCAGDTQSDILNAETINFCAKQDSVTYTGSGDISVTGGVIECVEGVECWEEFIMDVANMSSIAFSVTSTGDFAIEWEPGIIDTYIAGSGSRSHIYPTAYTGQLKIKAPSLSYITSLNIASSFANATGRYLNTIGTEMPKLTGLAYLNVGFGCNANLYCAASQLPASLVQLYCYRGNLSGNVADLPSGLTFFNNIATTIGGSIADLPAGLTYCVIAGSNTVNGNLSTLPVGLAPVLTRFEVYGTNTISGNIGSFTGYSALNEIRIEGDNTITGNISGLSGITTLDSIIIYGKNTLSGNLSSLSGLTSLYRFIISNDEVLLVPGVVGNTITGDIVNLPASVTSFVVGGYNTISGDVSDIPAGMITFDVRGVTPTGGNTITGDISLTPLPATVTTFVLQGDNTITGDIADMPAGMIEFNVAGDNTLFGNLGDTPSTLKTIDIRGDNTITAYNGKTWINGMRNVSIVPNTPADIMVQPDLDNLIIDLNAYTWQAPSLTFTPEINLRGNLGAGPAVVAAYNSLTTVKNVTVTITPFP